MIGLRAEETGALGVLLYHDVSESGHKWSISASVFESQIARALDLGCRFLAMKEVEKRFRTGRGFPPRSLCVHFDDARDGVYRNAWPVLSRLEVPATIYVVSDWPDGPTEVPISERYSGFMAWDEISEMAADPLVEIGSHGRTHRSLKRVPWWELGEELKGSKARIENELGTEVHHFAAPYNRSRLWTRWLARWVGYETFAVGGGGPTRGCRPAARFYLRRWLISQPDGVERLESLVDLLAPNSPALSPLE